MLEDELENMFNTELQPDSGTEDNLIYDNLSEPDGSSKATPFIFPKKMEDEEIDNLLNNKLPEQTNNETKKQSSKPNKKETDSEKETKKQTLTEKSELQTKAADESSSIASDSPQTIPDVTTEADENKEPDNEQPTTQDASSENPEPSQSEQDSGYSDAGPSSGQNEEPTPNPQPSSVSYVYNNFDAKQFMQGQPQDNVSVEDGLTPDSSTVHESDVQSSNPKVSVVSPDQPVSFGDSNKNYTEKTSFSVPSWAIKVAMFFAMMIVFAGIPFVYSKINKKPAVDKKTQSTSIMKTSESPVTTQDVAPTTTQGVSFDDLFADLDSNLNITEQQPGSDTTQEQQVPPATTEHSQGRFSTIEELSAYIEQYTSDVMFNELSLVNNFSSGIITAEQFSADMSFCIEQANYVNRLLLVNKNNYISRDAQDDYNRLSGKIEELIVYGENAIREESP